MKIRYFSNAGVKFIYSIKNKYFEVRATTPDKTIYIDIQDDYDDFVRTLYWFKQWKTKTNPITDMFAPYPDVEFGIKILTIIIQSYEV